MQTAATVKFLPNRPQRLNFSGSQAIEQSSPLGDDCSNETLTRHAMPSPYAATGIAIDKRSS
jgi:hypothetical protein